MTSTTQRAQKRVACYYAISLYLHRVPSQPLTCDARPLQISDVNNVTHAKESSNALKRTQRRRSIHHLIKVWAGRHVRVTLVISLYLCRGLVIR